MQPFLPCYLVRYNPPFTKLNCSGFWQAPHFLIFETTQVSSCLVSSATLIYYSTSIQNSCLSHYLQHEKLLSDDLQGSALLVLQQFSPSIRSTFGNAASKHFCVLFHGSPHTQRHQKRRSNNNFSFKTTPRWQWQWHPAVSDDIWQLSLLRHWSRFCTDPQMPHKLLQQELGAPGWHSTGTALEVQLSSNC